MIGRQIALLGYQRQPALQPDEHMALQLLRIVQEALSNAIKHSRATKLAVRFEADRRFLRVIVSDNGTGIAGGNIAGAHGLSGIRKRAHDIQDRPGDLAARRPRGVREQPLFPR